MINSMFSYGMTRSTRAYLANRFPCGKYDVQENATRSRSCRARCIPPTSRDYTQNRPQALTQRHALRGTGQHQSRSFAFASGDSHTAVYPPGSQNELCFAPAR